MFLRDDELELEIIGEDELTDEQWESVKAIFEEEFDAREVPYVEEDSISVDGADL